MSTSTPTWRIVAEREISSRLKDKTFLGTFAFTIALVIVAFAVFAFINARTASYDVAVTDAGSRSALSAAQQSLRSGGKDDAKVTAKAADDRAAAEALVRDGGVDAALVPSGDGFAIIGEDKVDSDLRTALRAGVAGQVLSANAQQQGVDLRALQAGTTARVTLLDPGPGNAAGRSVIAVGFAVIFLVTALGFGMAIAQSVVQEKESRIVEILAAAVPIRSLLWGKVIGNSVLALGQVVVIALVSVAGLVVTGQRELLSGVGPAIVWYLALFVLGFVSLASLWSVAGSLAARQQDLQSTTMPGQLLLMVPYFVAVAGGEGIKTVFSMLPIVSTMIMPGRIAEGGVPLWQVLVAIATTVVAAVVFVRIGERLYERSLLRTGSKLGYREVLTANDG